MIQCEPEPIPTRRSLLGRIRDWQDHESWREFFQTYWRLVYNVALKSVGCYKTLNGSAGKTARPSPG